MCVGAAQAVIAAMKKQGVKRLICRYPPEASATTPLRSSAPPSSSAASSCALFLRGPYANHARAEELIRSSGLDFTVVRPVQLVDGPTNGTAVAVPIGAETLGSLKVAHRSAVAAFMVEELAARKFVGQMPLLHG